MDDPSPPPSSPKLESPTTKPIKPAPKQPGTKVFRSKHTRTTQTTELQEETELECEPFFTDISLLPPDQIQHLRMTGYLRSQPNNNSTSPPSSSPPPSDETNNNNDGYEIQLLRNKHTQFLNRPFHPSDVFLLSRSYISLDSSRPWILYWTLHSLDLLSAVPENEEKMMGVVHTLEACWTPMEYRGCRGTREGGGGGGGKEEGEEEEEEAGEATNTNTTPNKTVEEEEGGGFGGGPGQMPHCATTYAAVLCLVIIAGLSDSYPKASRMALDLLQRKRKPLYIWFLTLRCLYHPSKSNNHTTTTSSPSSSSSSSSTDAATTVPCGYRMHHDGEVDVRASYTLCSVASLLNILTPELTQGAIEYIVLCQTFEGGFGGCPFAEAHGGYTFCALAALHILVGATTTTTTTTTAAATKKMASLEECCEGLDEDALRGWLSRRQMAYEGGFQGRSNKLVDGCYSFWIGGAIAVLDLGMGGGGNGGGLGMDVSDGDGGNRVGGASNESEGGGEKDGLESTNSSIPGVLTGHNFDSGVYGHGDTSDGFSVLRRHRSLGDNCGGVETKNNDDNDDDDEEEEAVLYNEGGLMFDQKLLQRYILLCAQDVNGGLRDKPSKGRDFYHSCYNLSGLSVSQHVLTQQRSLSRTGKGVEKEFGEDPDSPCVPNVIQYERVGYNVVAATHPVYNVRLERVLFVLDAFHRL